MGRMDADGVNGHKMHKSLKKAGEEAPKAHNGGRVFQPAFASIRAFSFV